MCIIQEDMNDHYSPQLFRIKGGEVMNTDAVHRQHPHAPDDDRRVEEGTLSASEISEHTLLRNILYCFHFLDTKDREYINSSEAEEYIRQLKDNNPELFDIMYNVLLVVKRSRADDTIAKELFIKRCEESLREMSPHDTSPINRLRVSVNPITEYFHGLKNDAHATVNTEEDRPHLGTVQGAAETKCSTSLSQKGYNVTDNGGNRKPSDKNDSCHKHEDECTFKPKTNKTHYSHRDHDVSLMLKEEIKEMHRFRYSKFALNGSRLQCCSAMGSTNGMNEYIVFHFNRQGDWPGTLRPLKDHNMT